MTTGETSDFDPGAYWEERLTDDYTLEGVGWSSLGEALNEWMYRVRGQVFLREMRTLFGSAGDLKVLDIGSGTGFYVERWHDFGVRHVVGSDITAVAVGNLRGRFPGDEFVQFDVGGGESPLGERRFDVVSAFDVLFHIVDDERFLRALRNIHDLLAPGGVFVLTDNFVHGQTMRGRHQTSRPLHEIEQGLAQAGFRVQRRTPVFVLLNTPVDSDSRVLRTWWKYLAIAASRSNALGWALGAAAYPVELGLTRVLREGPSTELMICRRSAP
jgi:SAM-dependent methyltransferase